MVEHHIALEQPVLVLTFITIVTVVTIEMEAAMLDVFLLVTGLEPLPVREVRSSTMMYFILMVSSEGRISNKSCINSYNL